MIISDWHVTGESCDFCWLRASGRGSFASENRQPDAICFSCWSYLIGLLVQRAS